MTQQGEETETVLYIRRETTEILNNHKNYENEQTNNNNAVSAHSR